jgi:hypothetical protein
VGYQHRQIPIIFRAGHIGEEQENNIQQKEV